MKKYRLVSIAVLLLVIFACFPRQGATASLDSWAQQTSGTIRDLKSVIYANDQYVAVGASGTIVTSPDGAVWTPRSSGVSADLNAVSFGNNMYVVVGENGTLLTSVNGASWSQVTTVSTSISFQAIAYGNGRFVAVGMHAYSRQGMMVTSADGVVWSSTVHGSLTGVSFAGGRFVVAGFSVGAYEWDIFRVILISSDGVTWLYSSSVSWGCTDGEDTAYGNGLYVSVSRCGQVDTSLDGSAWQQAPSPRIWPIDAIVFAEGRFVIAGNTNTILSSADGLAWVIRATLANPVTDVAYGNDRFIAVGPAGKIFLSGVESSDTIPPDTSIDNFVAPVTNEASLTVSFSASETPATFECSLDSDGYTPCTSPVLLAQLASGSHTFRVRAIDGAGNVDVSPSAAIWTIDTLAPDTAFTSFQPALVSSTSAAFVFTANEAGSSFECSLDNAAFAACNSPISFTGLANGGHFFTVRAIDPAGNTDSSPARAEWVVDSIAPDTSITGGPAILTNATSATFNIASTENHATFMCGLDGGSYNVCSAPAGYHDMLDGSHTVRVFSIDTAGNPDASVAEFSWTIDTVPPNTTVVSAPAANANSSTAAFAFSATEPASIFECSLDSGAYSACTSPVSLENLDDGDHTFRLRAIDQAGNVEATAVVVNWTVDTVATVSSLTAAPATTTNTASLVLNVSAGDAVSYRYQLDGGPLTPATPVATPIVLSNLADGQHVLALYGKDAAGNWQKDATHYSWSTDTVAPIVTLHSSPLILTNSASATFEFAANEPVAVFSCKFDDGAFSPCSGTVSYFNLAEGEHRLDVFIVDLAGNISVTTLFTWTVDTIPPVVTVASAPVTVTSLNSITVNLAAGDFVMYRYQFDGGAFGYELPAGAPISLSNLSDGDHVVNVIGMDTAGNWQATPTRYAWKVDTQPPTAVIDAKPPALTNGTSGTVSFTPATPDVTCECKLDLGNFAPCSGSFSYFGLTDGTHTLLIRMRDQAGNISVLPEITWNIDTVRPVVSLVSAPVTILNVTNISINIDIAVTEVVYIRYRLNGGAYSDPVPANQPINLDNLPGGKNVVDFIGQDPAGNWQEIPTSYSFTVEKEFAYKTLEETSAYKKTSLSNDWINPAEQAASEDLVTHLLYPYPGYSMNSADHRGLPGRDAMSDLSADSGKIPLILVHGWQEGPGFIDPTQLVGASTSAEKYFSDFIGYFNSNPMLNSRYRLYLYKYPSYKHINYNAKVLKELVEEITYLKDRDLVIIGHSMGGLVSRSLIEEHKQGRVRKLLTLATPHHGSPGAMKHWVDLAPFAKDVNTPGANDLFWDNYDGIFEWAQYDMDLAGSGRVTAKAFDDFYRGLLAPNLLIKEGVVNNQYTPNSSGSLYRYSNPWLSWLNEKFRKEKPITDYIFYAGYDEDRQGSQSNTIVDDKFQLATPLVYNAGYVNDSVVPVTSGLFDCSKHDDFIDQGQRNEKLFQPVYPGAPWKSALYASELILPQRSYIYANQLPVNTSCQSVPVRLFKDYHHDRMLNDVPDGDFTSAQIRQNYLDQSLLNLVEADNTKPLFDSIQYDLLYDTLPQKNLVVGVGGTGNGSVASVGDNSIQCGADCESSYQIGSTVKLEAPANPGAILSGWDGCPWVAEDKSCSVFIGVQPNRVVANFAEVTQPVLTLTPPAVSGASSGSVSFDTNAVCRCKFDNNPFTPCQGLFSYAGLADGQHVLVIEALGGDGMPAKDPVTVTWDIDTVAPDVTVVDNFPAVINAATFANIINITNITINVNIHKIVKYVYELDGYPTASSPVYAASEPIRFADFASRLAEGDHLINIFGIDAAGNRQVVPTLYRFKVDLTPPKPTLVSSPPLQANLSAGTFNFTVDDPSAVCTCTLDTVASPCNGSFAFSNLTDGEHTFVITAIDAAGNVSTAPVEFAWRVQEVDHFDFALDQSGPIPDAVNGRQLNLLVTAKDRAGNVVSLNGDIGLAVENGSVSPATIRAGQPATVTIDLAGTNRLTVFWNGVTSSSGQFFVYPAITAANFNLGNVGTKSDEFQMWLDITADDASNSDICGNYSFSVVGNAAKRAVQISPSQGEPCVRLADSNRYRLWFTVDKDETHPHAAFVEGGGLYMTGKAGGASLRLDGVNGITVHGSTFDLVQNAYGFANSKWKTPNSKNNDYNIFWGITDTIDNYISDDRRSDLWSSIGYVGDNGNSKKGGGLCYGLAASAIANYNHTASPPWGTTSNDGIENQDSYLGQLDVDISDHWTHIRSVDSGLFKPFLSNNLFSSNETSDRTDWTPESAKKALYYFASQTYFSPSNIPGSDWVGSDTSPRLEVTDTRLVQLLKTGSPALAFISFSKNGHHVIALVQKISWDNHDKYVFWDNARPHKDYQGYSTSLEWYVDAHEYHQLFDGGANLVKPLGILNGDPAVNPAYVLTTLPHYLASDCNVSQNIYNMWPNDGTNFCSPSQAVDRAPGITQTSYEHSTVSLYGGIFDKVVDTGTNQQIEVIPEGEVTASTAAINRTMGGYFNVLTLFGGRTYRVYATKTSTLPGLKVFARIPNADGTIETINYENIQTGEKDPTQISFLVGRQNADKAIRRSILNTSYAPDVYLPDYDSSHNLLPNPVQGFLARSDSGGVILSWSKSDHPAIDAYRVVRKESGQPRSLTDGAAIYQGNALDAVDDTVLTGKFYSYAVFAIDSRGNISEPTYAAVDTGRYSVYGRVTLPAGSPLAEAEISLSDEAGKLKKIAYSNAEGNYVLSNLPSGRYSIAPAHLSHSFDALGTTVSVDGINVNRDFVATPKPTLILLFDDESVATGNGVSVQWSYRSIANDARVNVELHRGGSIEVLAANVPISNGIATWKVFGPIYNGAILRIALTANPEVHAEKIINIVEGEPVPAWRDITVKAPVTKGSALYDRLNICYYTFNTIRNGGTTPISGPARLVITNPSIPVKTLQAVGLKLDGYTDANEPYFNVIPQGGALAVGASLANKRINFDNLRIPLSYGVRVEQYQ